MKQIAKRLLMALLIIIALVCGILTFFPEVVFYTIRWIITGKSYPDMPLVVRMIAYILDNSEI